MLTYEEYMTRIRETTAAWSNRYGDRIPNDYPAGSNPHDGQESDYAIHYAQFGAAPEFMDLLEERLAPIDAEWNAPENAPNRRAARLARRGGRDDS